MSTENWTPPDHPTPGELLQSGRVAILLCTYNGADFLAQQIDSILNQTYKNWVLHISDDGSTDTTLEIIETYQRQLGTCRLQLHSGPRQGFAKNFISLAQHTAGQFDFYAFSDQDDLWFPEKLERGLAQLKTFPLHSPTIYCSRTRLIDAHGHVIGESPLFSKPTTFQNALVQSIAGANTMVINQSAMEVLTKIPDHLSIVAHDWLAYLLITAVGGTTVFDIIPGLDYRQHEGNLIGANAGMLSGVLRLYKMLGGRSKGWSESNLAILLALRHDLPLETIKTLDNFILARHSILPKRLYLMYKSGIYRQTRLGNMSLFLAVLLNKI